METQTHPFGSFGLSEPLVKAIIKKGFEEPTQIQKEIIPKVLNSDLDLIGQAQTGTGKTAAFGIPLMDRLETGSDKNTKVLVMAPTRELAIQVAEEINSLKGKKRLSILPVYGGQSIENQINKLKRGVDIVVGTPGRILDHLKRRTLKLGFLEYLILDEADEMLNMGFIDDIEDIMSYMPEDRRTLLFSATMPAEILAIAKKYMKEYDIVRVKSEQLTTDLTDQLYFEVNQRDKFEALCRILDIETDFYGLIFCRTKKDVDEICNRLLDRGYDAEAIHGDISQYQRERLMKKFKEKRSNILVATDVAARGLDIQNLTHVINYSLPQDPESYVHRIGRTGRAGKEGTAITFVTPSEYRKLVFIKKIAKTKIKKEKIPGISEVLKAKQERLLQDVSSLIANGIEEKYYELADEFLNNSEAKDVLAALLKHQFPKEFNQNYYQEIQDVSIDHQGKTRLFVALGREDGISPRTLVDLITDQSGVKQYKIQEVKIFDHFSFITAPFEEAEIILEVFKKNKRGRKSLIARAKPINNQQRGANDDKRRTERSNSKRTKNYRGRPPKKK